MRPGNHNKIILILSVLLTLLVASVSLAGIFIKDLYAKETLSWQVQSIGQDVVDLFVIVPVLVYTAFLCFKKTHIASLLWAGVVLYILYTFIIYCFDVHFNNLFIIYCLTLGLSFYSLVWFLYQQRNEPSVKKLSKGLGKITGIYLIIVAVAFYILWLSEIVPSITNNAVPQSLIDTGLFTNPIQAIDIAVFLPGTFITGILVLKKKTLGSSLAIIILSFFILMDITIGWLSFFMKQKGVGSDLSVTIVMAALALFSLILLGLNVKNLRSGTLQ